MDEENKSKDVPDQGVAGREEHELDVTAHGRNKVLVRQHCSFLLPHNNSKKGQSLVHNPTLIHIVLVIYNRRGHTGWPVVPEV